MKWCSLRVAEAKYKTDNMRKMSREWKEEGCDDERWILQSSSLVFLCYIFNIWCTRRNDWKHSTTKKDKRNSCRSWTTCISVIIITVTSIKGLCIHGRVTSCLKHDMYIWQVSSTALSVKIERSSMITWNLGSWVVFFSLSLVNNVFLSSRLEDTMRTR